MGQFKGAFGGSGPWPREGLVPDSVPVRDYEDGYDNIPAHFENPTELALDELVMARRMGPSEAVTRRWFRLGVGNVTGTKNGPPEGEDF